MISAVKPYFHCTSAKNVACSKAERHKMREVICTLTAYRRHAYHFMYRMGMCDVIRSIII